MMQNLYQISKITKPSKVSSRKNKELRQLAHDLYVGRIFCDWQIPKGERDEYLPSVFMAFMLMDVVERKQFLDSKPGMMYAYRGKDEMPRGVNGYPVFSAIRVVNRNDAKKVWNYYQNIKESMKQYA